MRKLIKFVTGTVLAAALFMSSIPAQAQAPSLTYVARTAFHITTATTTTVTSSDAYVAAIVIATSAVGTGFKVDIKNKEGTAKYLIFGTSAAGTVTVLLGKNAELYAKGGIDIVSTGTPGVIDVFITYYKA